MFQNNRYLTRGVAEKIPLELQLLMWNALNAIPEPKDYFQVFRLSVLNGIQRIEHANLRRIIRSVHTAEESSRMMISVL